MLKGNLRKIEISPDGEVTSKVSFVNEHFLLVLRAVWTGKISIQGIDPKEFDIEFDHKIETKSRCHGYTSKVVTHLGYLNTIKKIVPLVDSCVDQLRECRGEHFYSPECQKRIVIRRKVSI